MNEDRRYQTRHGAPEVPHGGDADEDSFAGIVILVVGLLLVALGAVAYFVWPSVNAALHPTPSSTAPYIPPPASSASPTDNRVPILHVTAGVCFNQKDLQDSGQKYVWPVDCTRLHDSEVFFAQVLPAGDYPDADGWQANASQYCHPAFQAYVGIDSNLSRLNIFYVFPPPDVWNAGDRMLVCYAVDPESLRNTSIAGTKQ